MSEEVARGIALLNLVSAYKKRIEDPDNATEKSITNFLMDISKDQALNGYKDFIIQMTKYKQNGSNDPKACAIFFKAQLELISQQISTPLEANHRAVQKCIDDLEKNLETDIKTRLSPTLLSEVLQEHLLTAARDEIITRLRNTETLTPTEVTRYYNARIDQFIHNVKIINVALSQEAANKPLTTVTQPRAKLEEALEAITVQKVKKIQAIPITGDGRSVQAAIADIKGQAKFKEQQVRYMHASASNYLLYLTTTYGITEEEIQAEPPPIQFKRPKNEAERIAAERAIAIKAIKDLRAITIDIDNINHTYDVIKKAKTDISRVSGIRPLAKQRFYDKLMLSFPELDTRAPVSDRDLSALLHPDKEDTDIQQVRHRLLSDVRQEILKGLEDSSLSCTEFAEKCDQAIKTARITFGEAKKYKVITRDPNGQETDKVDKVQSDKETDSFEAELAALESAINLEQTKDFTDAAHLKASLETLETSLMNHTATLGDSKKISALHDIIEAIREDIQRLGTDGILEPRSGNQIAVLNEQLRVLDTHKHQYADRMRGKEQTTSQALSQFYQTVLDHQDSQLTSKSTDELAIEFLLHEVVAGLKEFPEKDALSREERANRQTFSEDELSGNEIYESIKREYTEKAIKAIENLKTIPTKNYEEVRQKIEQEIDALKANILTQFKSEHVGMSEMELQSITKDLTKKENKLDDIKKPLKNEHGAYKDAANYLADELSLKHKDLSTSLKGKDPGKTVQNALTEVLKAMEADAASLRLNGHVVQKTEPRKHELLKFCAILEKGDITLKSSIRAIFGSKTIAANELTDKVKLYKDLIAKEKGEYSAPPPAPSM